MTVRTERRKRSTRRWLVAAIVVVIGLAGLALLFRSGRVDAPFTDVVWTWSLAVEQDTSPVAPTSSWPEPSLTGDDTGLVDVTGVADPFLVVDNDTWYLFYEIIVPEEGFPNGEHGVIGVARDVDGVWRHQEVVLEEPFHLSYPNVFEVEGSYYMVPESSQDGRVILYRSDDFPRGWTEVATLLEGTFTDPTVFRSGSSWWMFATTSTDVDDDTLRLFSAQDLAGPWVEHPASPVVLSDTSRARQAGAVIDSDGRLIRYAQDNTVRYGYAVRAFEIIDLTPTSYGEREIAGGPVVEASGSGWNADGMHHISAVPIDDRWVIATDGYRQDRVFGFDR